MKLITSHPLLLGAPSVYELQARLDFLSRVAGVSTADLNNAGSLFTRSLDGRLRTRYFHALMKGVVHRNSTSTLMTETDPSYVATSLGLKNGRKNPASDAEVARYRKLVTSPKFVAWRERQEAAATQARRHAEALGALETVVQARACRARPKRGQTPRSLHTRTCQQHGRLRRVLCCLAPFKQTPPGHRGLLALSAAAFRHPRQRCAARAVMIRRSRG